MFSFCKLHRHSNQFFHLKVMAVGCYETSEQINAITRRNNFGDSHLSISHREWPITYRGADKSLARPGRQLVRKHVRDARFQQNRDASCHQVSFPARQGKAPKEIHAILTEKLACFLPGRAKDLQHPCTINKFFFKIEQINSGVMKMMVMKMIIMII